MHFPSLSAWCSIYTLFLSILLLAGCDLFNGNSAPLTAGIYVDEAVTDKNYLQLIDSSPLPNLLNCTSITPDCEFIEKIESSNPTKIVISISNGRSLTVRLFESEFDLLSTIENGTIDGALNFTNWARATEIERHNPLLSLRASKAFDTFHVHTNTLLPDFLVKSPKLVDQVFFGQIRLVDSITNGTLIKLESSNEVTVSIARSDSIASIAKLIKLGTPLKEKTARLYVEPNGDFAERKKALLEEKWPYLRISTVPDTTNIENTQQNTYQLHRPILLSNKFKKILD